MATLQHNISGELATVLLSQGDNINVKSISIANTHATDSTFFDLYIGTISKGGKASVSYYLNKGYLLHKGSTVILTPGKFSNAINGFGLFIKLTPTIAGTPTVDVIISK